jgi:hypothetical protein
VFHSSRFICIYAEFCENKLSGSTNKVGTWTGETEFPPSKG